MAKLSMSFSLVVENLLIHLYMRNQKGTIVLASAVHILKLERYRED